MGSKTKTRKVVFELNFQWDDGPESRTIVLTVPKDVTDEDIIAVIKDCHRVLCEDEDDMDIYGTEGRSPETLMNYVCEVRGWSWKDVNFALDLD